MGRVFRKIATQSEYTFNGNTTQSVAWEHFDASGMSYRSTASNGNEVVGDGAYNGAPAELDPMGANVGLTTPYIQLELPPPPEPSEIFPFFPSDYGDTMMIDGQRVPCTLDGFAIGCSQAMDMLDHGSAIPAFIAHLQTQPGFSFQSHGLGIFTATFSTYTPGYWTDTDVRIVDGDDGGTTIGGGPVWHPASWGTTTVGFAINWGPQQTPQPPQSQPPTTSSKPKLARIMKAANDCLNELWASSTRALSMTINEIANSGVQDGIITVTANSSVDRESAGPRFSSSSFSIVTDARSATGGDLIQRYNRENPDNQTRGSTYLPGYTPYHPNTSGTGVNLIANDLRGGRGSTHSPLGKLIGLDLALQLHEGGNSISARFGYPEELYSTYFKMDDDAGMRLEECVHTKLR